MTIEIKNIDGKIFVNGEPHVFVGDLNENDEMFNELEINIEGITGSITTNGNVVVNGTVHGNIECNNLEADKIQSDFVYCNNNVTSSNLTAKSIIINGDYTVR